MDFKHKQLLYTLVLLFTVLYPYSAVSASSSESASPCNDRNDLFLFIDRPSVQDSACVAPDKAVVIETGYEYQKLLVPGSQQNLPNSVFRLGVANGLEVNVTAFNYVHQTIFPFSGIESTILGIKRELFSGATWIFSMEGILTLPSGSVPFGSRKTGETVNALFGYDLGNGFNLSGMFGASSISEPIFTGGHRFYSFNPDLVLAWNNNNISIYGEVFGQSKTANDQGSGFNFDTGILFRVKKNLVVDLVVGKRISGLLDEFNYYLGGGVTFQIG